MFRKISTNTVFHNLKSPSCFIKSLEKREFKVSVIGASGSVGAPTMMLLKMNPLVSSLVGIDRSPSIKNMVSDLSQLNFRAKVRGYVVSGKLDEALRGSKLVIQMANSVPIASLATDNDLFKGSAKYVNALAELVSATCPDACFVIATNPINSMVPLFCKAMEKIGTLNSNKVFGMCKLAAIRASSYIAELKGLDPREVKCPVIGGHSSKTIVPLLSHVVPKIDFANESLQIISKNIQNIEDKMVGFKSSTPALATAYATASLADSILRGLRGQSSIGDYAYVKSNVCGTKYFATPLILGKNGIEMNLGVPKLNKYEESLLETCITNLSKEIEKGENFAM